MTSWPYSSFDVEVPLESSRLLTSIVAAFRWTAQTICAVWPALKKQEVKLAATINGSKWMDLIIELELFTLRIHVILIVRICSKQVT